MTKKDSDEELTCSFPQIFPLQTLPLLSHGAIVGRKCAVTHNQFDAIFEFDTECITHLVLQGSLDNEKH